MVDGEIAIWFIAEGDHFKEGQAILEVATDKAEMAYNATEEGYLAKILIPAGKSKVRSSGYHIAARRGLRTIINLPSSTSFVDRKSALENHLF